MQLSKIRIRNYRLLIDAELEVDPKTTLIVGRNNTAKTSCFVCIGNVLEGKNISFNDYPLLKREDFYTKIALFMEKKLSYEDLCKQVEVISIDFLVDYSLDDPDDNLGALSPFIIDVDVDTTTALIRAEYRLKTDEKTLWALLESSYYKDGAFAPNEEAHDVLADNFGKLFGLTVYAINPNNLEDKQVKSQKELHDLFPFHAIPAERVLGEDDTQNSSLGSLISGFFDMSEGDLDPEVAEEIKRLRTIVEKANKNVQKQSDEILSAVVNSSIGFGYPNIEELKLGVTTQLSIDDQIKNQTKLSYISGTANESLPSSYNGLGYKNLIKMEFLLAAFAKDIEKRGVACVPLLFIEEPESHMHPQMQTAFATYLEKFLGKLSDVKIQTFLTSHSAHIANTMEFAKVRYAQKSSTGVIYKNLNTGPRRTDRNFKNELPPEELKSRLNKVTEKIKQETPADEELKVLMITHKVLATQQGYEKLLDILNDGLRDKEDPFLLFFMETVEPIYHALNTSDMQLLFDILGIKRYPITKKVEKNKWKELQRQLDEARKKRAIDVFEIINRTKLIPIPPKLDGWYHLYQNTPETIYASNTSIEAFLNLDYAQFIAVKDFLHPEAQYSTEHGVKGEEYDNVIFVISKGWNQYQFETYAPMITKKAVIPSGKQASFERNRNLFYVCCSRPKKRLIFFVTVPIDSTFKSFLVELVGEQNIFTFSQYIERKSIK